MMHNSIRLLVLAIVFQSLGCTLLVGRVTDAATADNSSTLSTSSGNRTQTAFTLSDQPSTSPANEFDQGKLNAPIVARSTSRPSAAGLTVEEIRAERMAQSEARRQRDLRFAEVQREVAERLHQQQDNQVVTASHSQLVNTPTKNDPGFGSAQTAFGGSSVIGSVGFGSANDSPQTGSSAMGVTSSLCETTDANELEKSGSVSSVFVAWTAERPQLWMITIVVLAISGITLPMAKHRLRWTVLRQRSSVVEQPVSETFESEYGVTEAADESEFVASVHAAPVMPEVESCAEKAGTPLVLHEKCVSVEEQSWTSNLTAPISEYSVDCIANWNAADLELAQEPISAKQLSVDVEQTHLPQTPVVHKPMVDSPLLDSPKVDSPKVDSAIVDSAIVDSAIVDSLKGQSPVGQLSLLRLPAPRIRMSRVTRRAASKCELIPLNTAQSDSSRLAVPSNTPQPRGYLPAPSRKNSLALVKLPYRAKRSKCRQVICVGRTEKSNRAMGNDDNANTQTALILHSSQAERATGSSGNRSRLPAAPRRKMAGFVVLYDQDASGNGSRRVMMVESYEITQQAELRARVVEVG